MLPPVMHPAKRRRLDQSSSTLAKPFRSPMKVDIKTHGRQVNPAVHTPSDHGATETDHHVRPCAKETDVEHYSARPTTAGPAGRLRRYSPASRRSDVLSSCTGGADSSADSLSLQKQHSALVLQLSKLRQSLDTAEQALKLQSSGRAVELEMLIRKWQLVSREAAEELFVSAQDYVSRIGGVRAWREQTHKPTRVWNEEEAASLATLTEEQKDEMQMEKRRYGVADVQEVVEKNDDDGDDDDDGGGGGGGGGDDDDDDDDDDDEQAFTMDMMLKSLNVELELIGYDKQRQRWVD